MKILFLIKFIYLSTLEIQEVPLDLLTKRKDSNIKSNDTDKLYPIIKETISISNDSEYEISNKESRSSHIMLNEEILHIKYLRKSIVNYKYVTNKMIKQYEKKILNYRYNDFIPDVINKIYRNFLSEVLSCCRNNKLEKYLNHRLENNPKLFLDKIDVLRKKYNQLSDTNYKENGIKIILELNSYIVRNNQIASFITEYIKFVRNLLVVNEKLVTYREKVIERLKLIEHDVILIYPELVLRKNK